MSGPANKRIKLAALEVTLDGQPIEVPTTLRSSLTAVHAFLESAALRQQALLASMVVDGVSMRLEKPMIPLKLFKRIDAKTARFNEFAKHLVPSICKKLAHLQNRAEVAVELATINEWPMAQRLWWDLLPDLKEPVLILNILAALPQFSETSPNYAEILHTAEEELERVLSGMDEAFAAQNPLILSDMLEQGLCVWLENLNQALTLRK